MSIMSNKPGALIMSHVFNPEKFDQLSDENLERHFRAFENEGYDKLIIIPTGMLNEHNRKPGMPDIDKKLEAFDLTYDFLKSKIKIILSLKIPFEIFSFDEAKYEEIEASVHKLFVTEGENKYELTEENLAAWRKRIITFIKTQKTLTVREKFQQALDDILKYYNENPSYNKEICKYAKKAQSNRSVKEVSCIRYLLDEAAFLLYVSRLNEDSLLSTNQKKIPILGYTGGEAPYFIKRTIQEVIRDNHGVSLIQLTENNTFEHSM